MKILVLGLESAAPELLLGFDDLPNLRQLMAAGAYGRLESVVPPTAVPGWICLATSQDPGSLGVYGSSSRVDRSYQSSHASSSWPSPAPAIWDLLGSLGKRSILVGVPPCEPRQRVQGISVGGTLSHHPSSKIITKPPEIAEDLRTLIVPKAADLGRFSSDDRIPRRDEIFMASENQFHVTRQLMQTQPWDYVQLVDTGLDRIQRGFWRDHDPQHVLHVPEIAFRDTIRDYYRHLDEEIGRVLELLTDDTVVLVVSSHGRSGWRGDSASTSGSCAKGSWSSTVSPKPLRRSTSWM